MEPKELPTREEQPMDQPPNGINDHNTQRKPKDFQPSDNLLKHLMTIGVALYLGKTSISPEAIVAVIVCIYSMETPLLTFGIIGGNMVILL
jgi:hypothetical protein